VYKIEIEWKMRSPSMRLLTGDIRIGKIDLGKLTDANSQSFPFKKEPGMLEYQNTPPIFARSKPLVDAMIRSYFDGMIFENWSVTWFLGCRRNYDTNTVYLKIQD
jgi:hypothetical protein